MSGVTLYYWLRVVDSWGNASAFATASATTERDASVLLDQLKNAVSLGELAAELAQPIASIDTIIPAALHDNALASLQSALSDYDLTQRVQWQEEVTNATIGVDPATGKIQLLATANVTTDVEQRLSQVEVVADAQQAALNSTVATLDTVQGDLSSTQSQVSQLAGQVTTKASQVYVDDAVADATGQITVTAANAYSALADQAIREALDSFEAAGRERELRASVAAAQQEIQTNADAIAAETATRTALVASVAANAAAIVDEQKVRADAVAAEALAREQLAARVTTVEGGVASNSAAIEREAKASADAHGAAAGRMDAITAVSGASGQGLAEQALRTALDQFDAAGQQRDLQASVAAALSSITAIADALRAEVVSRTQLVATVAGTKAAVVTEELARATGDEAVASLLEQVQARLDTGDYAAVKQQASATASKVGGIEAKYVLMVDANGHTAAMELGSADGRSHVVFLADDFLIAQPDGSGPPKQAFIVGTVNGITTVGIDGALLVDGSVVARHIAAKSLTVDQIDTRGLDIRDADGNVVFSAGKNLSVSRITGLGGLASKDVVGAADVSVSSLSAIVAYLGEIVGGKVRNTDGNNYVHFDAAGSQPFLQVGNNIVLRADGSGYFARSIVSAPNVVAAGWHYPGDSWWLGEYYTYETGSGEDRITVAAYRSRTQVVMIDTGISFPDSWNYAPSDMYAASATISGGQSRDGGGTGFGRAEVVVGDGLGAGGYVDGRVYIRYVYEHVGNPIFITSVAWKLVRL